MLSLTALSVRFSILLPLALSLNLLACRTTENTDLSVYGGREDYAIMPRSVGLVQVTNGVPEKHTYCTGGFITDRLLLTAAHCIFEGTEVAIVSESEPFKGKVISSNNLYVNPEYEKKSNSNGPFVDPTADDIGFVIFPPDTAPAHMIIEIAPIPPKVGDGVQLVGWGANRQTGSNDIINKRHYGRNKIAKIDDKNGDKIVLVGITFTDGAPEDVNNASAGKGDSGGPLFNDKDQVIGVTSNIGTLDESIYSSEHKLMNNTSFYANLHAPLTRKIVDAIIAQYRNKESSKPAAARK